MTRRTLVAVVGVTVAAVLAAQAGDAWARARFGGSRGSRSFSAPSRPAPTPSSPSRTPTFGYRQTVPASPAAPTAQQAPAQRRGFLSGMGGALGGFALGGLLGSLLFGGFGRGFGIGLMDIVILGGLAFLAWQFLGRRRESEEPAYAPAGASRWAAAAPATGRGTTAQFAPGAHGGEADLQKGIGHIRQMDAGFDPAAFEEWARTFFVNVQSCVAMRDVGMIRDRLTPEMYNVLQNQCQELKAAHRTNYVEKVQLDRAEVTEAWQEGGHDFVTVFFSGAMLDYTVDDRSGEVVEGTKTEPQMVEEHWTFTRPVGPNKWKLCAIESA
ncbi:MAG: Tim44 domain-containing protein [Candidatus Rokubacteria bacterium]|nr:Tim44 domain-containing protein [Candidatus Rokubacteria bacterium]